MREERVKKDIKPFDLCFGGIDTDERGSRICEACRGAEEEEKKEQAMAEMDGSQRWAGRVNNNPCFLLKLFSCLLLLTLPAFLLLTHQELLPQQPWFQLRAWQAQIASFVQRVKPNVQREAPSHHPPRLAVCLVGGARAFELTGPSLIKHLLQAHNNTDVFLYSPLDKDTFKFSLLKDVPNLIHIRIFSPQRIPQTRLHSELLTATGSPNGIQGLLQYFHLVEGCLYMINAHQSNFNFTYQWIIRTRVDGYWNEPLPLLENLKPETYTIPLGSRYGGLNDRLGIGNWETSKIALSRVTALPLLHSKGFRRLNSEAAFKYQLQIGKVKSGFMSFPFCILSHRRYGWPPANTGVPVVSISSRGHMNGAKCRPCSPLAIGKEAKRILETEPKSWSWIGNSNGVKLCDASRDWEANWRDIFDSVAGPEFAEVRKHIENQTLAGCIQEMTLLQKHANIWDAPSPTLICNRTFT